MEKIVIDADKKRLDICAGALFVIISGLRCPRFDLVATYRCLVYSNPVAVRTSL